MSVTLGVLALNNWKYTRAFLDSIDVDVDVLLIDNGSTDGTSDIAAAHVLPATGKPPRVVTMRDNAGRPRNHGVSAGWNALFKHTDAETLVIANNDITLRPGCINELLRAHRRLGCAVTSGWHSSDTRAPWAWGQGADYTLFALSRSTWERFPFDELYWPAYYEDCDHTIRLARAGLETCRTYDAVFDCPVVSRTLYEGVGDHEREEMLAGMVKGRSHFRDLYLSDDGGAVVKDAQDRMHDGRGSSVARLLAYLDEAATPNHERFGHVADFSEHVATLHHLAWQCDHVTEMGVRTGVSTAAILGAHPRRHVAYDVDRHPQVAMLAEVAGPTELVFRQEDVLTVDIEPTDLLFIDTRHTYAQLAAELARHANKARRYIVLHDTTTFGRRGEDGGPGLMPAVEELLARGAFDVVRHDTHCNGLMVLRRKNVL